MVTTRRYGQWSQWGPDIETDPKAVEAAKALLQHRLSEYCRVHRLRPVTPTTVTMRGHDITRRSAVFIAECQANGTPPDERIGRRGFWRELFCAP